MIFCNIKRFLAYSSHVLIIFYIMIAGNEYFKYLCYQYCTNTNSTHSKFVSFFPILIGILLALPKFISTIKKPGSLYFDWVVFIAAGFPALCIAITPFISQTQLAGFWPLHGLTRYHDLLTLSGIAFGYICLSAFHKKIKYEFPEYIWNGTN